MSLLLLITVLAFVMGLAIQRGSTCAVLAVEQLLRHRRPERFLGFFECGLWAALALTLLGLPPMPGPAWSAGPYLLGGAALFGVGAAINGACAFGTIARLGNGRLDYLLTGVAAYGGMAAMTLLGGTPISGAAAGPPAAALAPLLALGLLFGVMALRWLIQRRMFQSFAAVAVIMAIIGAVGAVLGATHQPWPWMQALAAGPRIGVETAAGLLGLIGGAVAGALIGGTFHLLRPSPADIGRRLAGGLAMGAGVMLVPGGNDTLILVGVPRGDLAAVLAYLTLLAAIALTLVLMGGLFPPRRKARP